MDAHRRTLCEVGGECGFRCDMPDGRAFCSNAFVMLDGMSNCEKQKGCESCTTLRRDLDAARAENEVWRKQWEAIEVISGKEGGVSESQLNFIVFENPLPANQEVK